MKICMIGLGSIGKRHLKNLIQVYKKNMQIDAVRSGIPRIDASVSELLCNQYYDLEIVPDDYDVIFITNPTYLHYETILKTMSKTKNMFIEKPVFEKCADQLKNIKYKNTNSVYYVACPLRHKAIMKYVKEKICKNEKIISVRVISSSFLPDWRKGVDYRECYSAHKMMGGGVSIDLIHEWDYLTDLFGYPFNIECKSSHLSNLEIDSDDVAVYIAEYIDKYVELHLDYIGHKSQRKMELYCSDKTYFVDLLENVVEEYQCGVLKNRMEFPQEDFYINEMKYFFECIAGRVENINPLENAYKTLALAAGEKDYL